MKKITPIFVSAVIFAGSAAAQSTITGTQDASNPASFNDAAAWGGTIPTFSKSTIVQLGGIAGATNYYKLDDATGDITIRKLQSAANVDGGFYLTTGTNNLTIDINAGSSYTTDAISFSDGSVQTFTLGEGNYSIISTGTTTGLDAVARIAMITSPLTADTTKTFTFARGSTLNAYTSLSLSGTVGAYGTMNVAGTINTYDAEGLNAGKLIVDWIANPYGTGGGTRTKVLVNDGGVINTGDLLVRPRAYLTVENGGTLSVSGTMSWSLSDTNPGCVLEVQTGGVANIENISYLDNATGVSGAQKILVTGGTLTAATVAQKNSYSVTTVSAGEFNVTDTFSIANGSFSVTGGTANLNNFTQTGGTVSVNGSGVMNLTGNISATSLNAGSGSINIKNGSTFAVSAATFKATAGGNFNVENGVAFTASDLMIFDGYGNSSINTVVNSTKTGTANFYSLQINSGHTLTFGSDAKFVNSSKFSRFSLNGNLVVNSGTGSIVANQLVFWTRNSTVTLNTKNALITGVGKYETIVNIPEQKTARFVLRATNQFGHVFFQGESASNPMGLYLDLDFASADDFVSFADMSVTGGSNGRIFVNNFENNRIKFQTKYTGENLFVTDFDGNAIDWEWVEDTANGGWWINAVVPEPAEWAAIFGALALALAACRRRK